MEHKRYSLHSHFYNVVKVGGNLYFRHSYDWDDETRELYDLVRVHGYDVITEGEDDFSTKLEEYNESLIRSAKARNESSYPKLNLDHICVCGDWMFTERDCEDLLGDPIPIPDLRGGKRTGSGRKAKYEFLFGTTPLRVPKYEKDKIKEFIDFLIEQQKGPFPVQNRLKNLAHVLLKVYVKEGENDSYLKGECEFLKELSEHIPESILLKDE